MADKRAGFVTGANAKIKIGTQTIAYATNVGYDISVQTIPIEGIGRYEVWSNEPVSFMCSGSLAIIRYTKRASNSSINNVAANGNSLDQITGANNSHLGQHLSPGALLASETFDLVIYEKGKDDATTSKVVQITDCRLTRRSGNLDKRGVLMDQFTFVGILAGDTNDKGNGALASASGDTDLGTT